MAPTYRTATQTRRGNRNAVPEHDDFEGLPVRQWRQQPINIAPPPPLETVRRPDRWAVELPFGMPKDWLLLPPHSQDLLRHARSGRLYKRPHPPEEEEADGEVDGGKGVKKESEGEKQAVDGVMVKVWKQVPRQIEGNAVSHLAKRHKNTITLPTKASLALSIPETTVTRATVRRVDAAGNTYEQTVILGEGETIPDGDIISSTEVTAPISSEAAAAAQHREAAVGAAPQTTPNRRRPPPPKRKNKGPGRGRKKSKLPLPATGAPVPGTAATSVPVPENAAVSGVLSGVDASAPVAAEKLVKLEVDDSAPQDVEMTDISHLSADEAAGDDIEDGTGGADGGEHEQKSHAEEGGQKREVQGEQSNLLALGTGNGYVASATAHLEHDIDSSDLSSPPSTHEGHSPPSHEASARASRASSQPTNAPAQLAYLTDAKPVGSPLRQVMTQTTPDNSKPASPTTKDRVVEDAAAGQVQPGVLSTQEAGVVKEETDGTEGKETLEAANVTEIADDMDITQAPEATESTAEIDGKVQADATNAKEIAPEPADVAESGKQDLHQPDAPSEPPVIASEPEPEHEPQSSTTDKDDNDDFDLLGGLERELDRQAGENSA